MIRKAHGQDALDKNARAEANKHRKQHCLHHTHARASPVREWRQRAGMTRREATPRSRPSLARFFSLVAVFVRSRVRQDSQ
jgi:hypothetical protein